MPFRYTLLNIILIVVILIGSFLILFVMGNMHGVVFSMYGILGCLAFAFFCRYVSFREKRRKENHQQMITTTTIFPVFRYDTEKAQMVQSDDLPLYAFLNLGIVIFWGMLVCILSVHFYLFAMFLMCIALSIGSIYIANEIYESKWMNASSELDDLNAKDVYLCLKQSVFSSMVGSTPPRDEGEIEIEVAVKALIRLFTQNENVEHWWTLRKIQCKELNTLKCPCRVKTFDINNLDDDQLINAAMKTKTLNPKIEGETLDYLDQLNNIELIDKAIKERTLNRAKRIASFIAQVRLTVRAKKLQKNEQRDLHLKAQKSCSSLVIPSPELNFIPRNVKYESGTHIELELIAASIFMPWTWVRVKELGPKNASITVFDSNFAGDLKYVYTIMNRQGEFGDCWIIAAMTMLAVDAPQYLTAIFPEGEKTEPSPDGKYIVKLYVDNEIKTIIVDDYFPCIEEPDSKYKLLATPFQYDAEHNKKIIWPMLIEKALATEYGSYENLNGGVIDDALNLLTGTAAFRYNLLNEDVKMKIADGSLWQKMMEYRSKSFLIGAGSLPKEMMPKNNMGIVPRHAYVIMDVLECDSHKLIELKNTWDDTLWNGRWSPFSSVWTRRLREIVAQYKAQKNNSNRERFGDLARPLVKVPKGGGKCFYMCLEDFLQYYEVIFFNVFFDEAWEKLVIRDGWTVGRCGGSIINSETVRYNPQYLIKVTKTTEIFFLLHQILPYSKFGIL